MKVRGLFCARLTRLVRVFAFLEPGLSELKKAVISQILVREGGYSHDPADSGGETNYGITIAVARQSGYHGRMIDMPRQVAVEIYSARYWDAMQLDAVEALSPAIAEKLADIGVNLGVSRAMKYLQRLLNVMNDRGRHYQDITVDGAAGGRTLEALGAYLALRGAEGVTVMLRGLRALQGEFYVALAELREKDERFIYGWLLNRVM